jgi:hypothetical protein
VEGTAADIEVIATTVRPFWRGSSSAETEGGDAADQGSVTIACGVRVGDFDAVRAMLADDVKLDLVATFQKRGKGEVGEYYGAYAAAREKWAFAAGAVDGRAAMGLCG